MTQKDNLLAPTRTFNEQITERIKESIGDLITDKDIGAMVDRSLEEIFFKPRVLFPAYGPRQEHPPLIHEIVRESLEPIVKTSVVEWIKNHEEEVHASIASVVEQGAGNAVMKALSSLFIQDLQNLGFNLDNRLRNL